MQKSHFFATNTNTLLDNIFARFLSLQVGRAEYGLFWKKEMATM